MDFGANAAGYVDTFIRNIDWEKANARYAAAVEHATGNLAALSEQVLGDLDGFTLLDVRRAGAFQAAKEVISGATWQDPEKIEEWSHTPDITLAGSAVLPG